MRLFEKRALNLELRIVTWSRKSQFDKKRLSKRGDLKRLSNVGRQVKLANKLKFFSFGRVILERAYLHSFRGRAALVQAELSSRNTHLNQLKSQKSAF